MTPRLVARPLRILPVRGDLLGRRPHAREVAVQRQQVRVDALGVPDALEDRLEVLLRVFCGGGGGRGALAEAVEGDVGRVARVRARQVYGPAVVAAVRFEDQPGPVVFLCRRGRQG